MFEPKLYLVEGFYGTSVPDLTTLRSEQVDDRFPRIPVIRTAARLVMAIDSTMAEIAFESAMKDEGILITESKAHPVINGAQE